MMQKIPKIIHYCWLSGDPFPKDIQRCIDSWKKRLPDYEFLLWDTRQFDMEQSIWVRQAFETKKYAFAADYIRLYALYHHGGIYLDTDVEIVKPFNDLLGLPYFAGTEGGGWIEAGIMGAEKQANWVKDCLSYFDKPFIKNDGTYDMITLPQVINRVIGNSRNIIVSSRQEILQNSNKDYHHTFYLFEKDFFCPKEMGTGIIRQTKNTYTIHHFAMSWIPIQQRWLPNLKRRLIRVFGEELILNIANKLKVLKKLK